MKSTLGGIFYHTRSYTLWNINRISREVIYQSIEHLVEAVESLFGSVVALKLKLGVAQDKFDPAIR